MRTFASCLLMLFIVAVPGHAGTNRCNFLLSKVGTRRVNPEWLRIGTSLSLSPDEERELALLHEYFDDLFGMGPRASMTSLQSEYFAVQLSALKVFARNLRKWMQTWQNRLQGGTLQTGRRQLKLLSEIERVETLLKHNATGKIQQMVPGPPENVQAWLHAARQALLDLDDQMQLQRDIALSFIFRARPVLDRIESAMNLTLRPGFNEVYTYAYVLAAIHDYLSKCLNPDLTFENFRNGRVTGEFFADHFKQFLSETREMAEAVLGGKPVEPDRITEVLTLVQGADVALEHGQIVVPVTGRLSAKAELAVGFLPVEFIRLPRKKSPDRLLDRMDSAGAVFHSDTTKALRDQENIGYDSRHIQIASPIEIPKLTKAFAVWETLVKAAKQSVHPAKTLALLHLIRYHEWIFAQIYHPDWSQPASVLGYFFNHIVVAPSGKQGHFVLNHSVSGAIQTFLSYYQREFGVEDNWTAADVVNSMDVLIAAVAKLPDAGYAGLDKSAVDSLKKSAPMHAFLVALYAEDRLTH